ncbi:60S ribosomal protein L43 [Pseudogymnoascus australis]
MTKRTKKVGVTGKYGAEPLDDTILSRDLFGLFDGGIPRGPFGHARNNLSSTPLGIPLNPRAQSAIGNMEEMREELALTVLFHRYGASLRKQVKKMEITQHARYVCTFCGKTTVRRHSVGIWDCKSCKKTVAGGAYVVSIQNSLEAVDCLAATAIDDGAQQWQSGIDIATRSESLGRNGASSTGLGEYIGM